VKQCELAYTLVHPHLVRRHRAYISSPPPPSLQHQGAAAPAHVSSPLSPSQPQLCIEWEGCARGDLDQVLGDAQRHRWVASGNMSAWTLMTAAARAQATRGLLEALRFIAEIEGGASLTRRVEVGR